MWSPGVESKCGVLVWGPNVGSPVWGPGAVWGPSVGSQCEVPDPSVGSGSQCGVLV